MRAWPFFSLLCPFVLVASARCSSSSASPLLDGGAHDGAGSCAPPTCTGKVSGGVTGEVNSCSLSAEQGKDLGLGKVTFSFTADGGSAGKLTGSGEVSTQGSFAKGSYSSDGGLWDDPSGADSLWTVSWGSTMVECNGVASPDAIASLCQAALTVTSVDACDDVHGTLNLTVPAYKGAPAVTLKLQF